MFVLHLDLKAKPDSEAAFEAFYREIFHPAIAKQPGFSQTQLLRDKAQGARTHRLIVAFESEALQQKWVATELHGQVASKLMESIAEVHSADPFDFIAR